MEVQARQEGSHFRHFVAIFREDENYSGFVLEISGRLEGHTGGTKAILVEEVLPERTWQLEENEGVSDLETRGTPW